MYETARKTASLGVSIMGTNAHKWQFLRDILTIFDILRTFTSVYRNILFVCVCGGGGASLSPLWTVLGVI